MKEEIYATYAQSDDSTFVMKATYNDDNSIASIECVGWYCGEPNDDATQQFSHGGDDLIAILEEKTNVSLVEEVVESTYTQKEAFKATLIINDKELPLIINSMDYDVISDDEVLIHINAAY